MLQVKENPISQEELLFQEPILVKEPVKMLKITHKEYLRLRSLYVLGKDTFINRIDYTSFKTFLQEKLDACKVPMWLQDDMFELASINNNWEHPNDGVLEQYFENNNILISRN